jgi:hypothetical protein
MQKTLGQIFGVDDVDDDGNDGAAVVPTTASALRSKIAQYDAERERLKQELTRRKLEAVRPGEADLARSTEKDLYDQMGRVEVIRGDLAADLQRLLQAKAMDEMHADDGETVDELQKLYAIRAAVIAKRTDPVDDKTRAALGLAINRREIKLATRR